MKQRMVFCIMRLQAEKYVDEYITKALFDLMKKKKYEDISITEITKRAGVGRVSFYRNFNSKEEVIKKWIKKTTDTFLKDSNINYKKDSIQEFFTKLFTHLENYKEQSFLIYKANLIYLLKAEFENRILKIYEEEYGSYKSYFLSGGIFNVYYFWLMNGCKEHPDVLADKLVDLLLK